MKKEEQKCLNCYYASVGTKTDKEGKEKPEVFGKCKRYPEHRQVHHNHYCGEWREK